MEDEENSTNNNTKESKDIEQEPLLEPVKQKKKNPLVIALCASIILLSIVVLFLLALMVVASVATYEVNHTMISLQSINMTKVQEYQFLLDAECELETKHALTATIKPSSTHPLFAVFYKDSLLASFSISKVELNGEHTATMRLHKKTVTIQDMALFEEFTTALLNEPQEWTLKGEVEVIFKGFSLGAFAFFKPVTIPSLGGLNNCSVTSLNVIGDHNPDVDNVVRSNNNNIKNNQNSSPGIDVVVESVLNNPSFVSMEIGDIHFQMYFQQQLLGFMTAKSFTLVPGDNKLVLHGLVSTMDDPLRSEKLGIFLSEFIAGKSSIVNVRGYVPESFNKPSWIKSVIEQINITTTLPEGQKLTLIDSLELGDVRIAIPGKPNEHNDNGLIFIGSKVKAGFLVPFPIALSVNSVSASLSMIKSNCFHDCLIATSVYNSPFVSANSDQTLKQLNFTIDDHMLRVVRDPFTDFSVQLLQQKLVEFVIKGNAVAQLSTAAGNCSIAIEMPELPVTLKGFNNFLDYPLTIKPPNVGVTGGHNWGIDFDFEIEMVNPSDVEISVFTLGMDFYSDDQYMGNVSIQSYHNNSGLFLKKGVNQVYGKSAYVKPENETLSYQFLSRYLQGNNSYVELRGNSYNVPLMINALQKINIENVTFPGQPYMLLDHAEAKFNLMKFSVESVLFLSNVFPVYYSVISIKNVKIYELNWNYLGTSKDIFYSPPLVVQPNTTISTTPVPVTVASFTDMLRYATGTHSIIGIADIEVSMSGSCVFTAQVQQKFDLIGY